jgi:hypothetical protein
MKSESDREKSVKKSLKTESQTKVKSIDSIEMSVKDSKTALTPEARVEKYIPLRYQKRAKEDIKTPSKRRFRRVRLDCNAIKSCTAYKQIFILVTTLVVIVVLLMEGCYEMHKPAVFSHDNRRLEDSQEDRSIKDETKEWLSKKSGVEGDGRPACNMEYYYFIFVCIIALSVEFFTLMLYLFHLIETFYKVCLIECFSMNSLKTCIR